MARRAPATRPTGLASRTMPRPAAGRTPCFRDAHPGRPGFVFSAPHGPPAANDATMPLVQFALLPLRLESRARDATHFPPGKAANVLRGAFGLALDQALFAPRLEGGPSGLADPPRPFVF